MFRLDVGIGYKVEFTDDATGTYRDSDGSDASYSYALKDLPTGDMPQTSFNLALLVHQLKDPSCPNSYRFYDRFFSDWSATSREFSEGENPDRRKPWQTPSYGIVDLNASADIPVDFNGITAYQY